MLYRNFTGLESLDYFSELARKQDRRRLLPTHLGERASCPPMSVNLSVNVRIAAFACFGDRRMNREAIEAALDACLLTDAEAERGLAAWAGLPDPFGDWEITATEAD